MLRTRDLRIALAFVASVASMFAIQSVDAAKPIILSSSTTATELTINGSDLAPGVASVLLGSYGPLTVNSQSTTQLVVTLPGGLTPGDYALSVKIGKGRGNGDRADDGNVDENVVTIGAVGPIGPQGPIGPMGVPGPSAPRAPRDFQAHRVLQGRRVQVRVICTQLQVPVLDFVFSVGKWRPWTCQLANIGSCSRPQSQIRRPTY